MASSAIGFVNSPTYPFMMWQRELNHTPWRLKDGTGRNTVRLEGAGGKFIIGADFWKEIVDWAFERELISECTARCHRSEDGKPFEVSSERRGGWPKRSTSSVAT